MKNFFLIIPITLLFLSCSEVDQNIKNGFIKLLTEKSSNGTLLFSFEVSDQFLFTNNSKPSKRYSGITHSEFRLLEKALKDNHYCTDSNHDLSFIIISKQQRVDDITSESLFKNRYNTRSLIPVTYFGRCL